MYQKLIDSVPLERLKETLDLEMKIGKGRLLMGLSCIDQNAA